MIKDPLSGKVLFTADEFACKASGGIRLAMGFADRLLALRLEFGQAMAVNSACRSLKHNEDVGGAPKSFHVYDFPQNDADGCCAVDIIRKNGEYPAELVELALSKGWSVGVSKHFMHLDRRVDFGYNRVLFGY